MATATFNVGDAVLHAQGRGIVRFFGKTDFAPENWVGIELALPKGKNDGSVQTKRYFTCKPMHGIFAKPESVQKDPSATVSAVAPANDGSNTVERADVASPSSSLASRGRKNVPAAHAARAQEKRMSMAKAATSRPAYKVSGRASVGRPSSISGPAAKKPTSPTETTSTTSRKSLSAAQSAPSASSARPAANPETTQLKQDLAHVKTDNDRLTDIINKLQLKIQPQSQEIKALKAELDAIRTENDRLENIQAQHDVELEHAILDRESAEVQLDTAQTEVDALHEKLADLEDELEVLRMEKEEYENGVTPEDRSSQSWIHMERENERLREALIRLRDATKANEADLKEEMEELQKDSEQLATVTSQLDGVRVELAEKTDRIGNLEEQLEAALESEDLVVSLTEKNEKLASQLEDANTTIEHLEDLVELNEDLEASFTATEAQLQEFIDDRDRQIITLKTHAAQQDEKLADQSFVITRLAQANTALTAQVQDLEASGQDVAIDTTHKEDILRLNEQIKVQQYMDSLKANRIETALVRLQAEQSTEHLKILQYYLTELPAAHPAILSYLQFDRLALKADLLRREMDTMTRSHSTYVVYLNLAEMHLVCGELVTCARTCTPDDFAAVFEDTAVVLRGIEESLDTSLDILSSSKDLNLRQIEQDLAVHLDTIKRLKSRTNVNMFRPAHVAEATIVMSSRLLANLDCSEKVLAAIERHLLPSLGKDPIDSAIHQLRTASTLARKCDKTLKELKSRHMMSGESPTKALADTSDVLAYLLEVCASVEGHDQNADEFDSSPEIHRILDSAALSKLNVSETAPLSGLTSRLAVVADQLRTFHESLLDLNNTTEFDTPAAPWVQEAEARRRRSQASSNAEEELESTRRALAEQKTATHMAARELEEVHLKIEHLEARHEANQAKLAELEKYRGLEENMLRRESETSKDIETLRLRIKLQEDQIRDLTHKITSQADVRKSSLTSDGVEVYGPRMRNLEWRVATLEKGYDWMRQEKKRYTASSPMIVMEPISRPDSAVGWSDAEWEGKRMEFLF